MGKKYFIFVITLADDNIPCCYDVNHSWEKSGLIFWFELVRMMEGGKSHNKIHKPQMHPKALCRAPRTPRWEQIP
jgi:hypothetical protein